MIMTWSGTGGSYGFALSASNCTHPEERPKTTTPAEAHLTACMPSSRAASVLAACCCRTLAGEPGLENDVLALRGVVGGVALERVAWWELRAPLNRPWLNRKHLELKPRN
jgi:hypothetical protein